MTATVTAPRRVDTRNVRVLQSSGARTLPMVTKAKRPKGRRPELLKAAEALKVCRQRMGVTQEELADLLGVAGNTVQRWEIAQREIPEMALRLLKFVEAEQRERAERRAARLPKGR